MPLAKVEETLRRFVIDHGFGESELFNPRSRGRSLDARAPR